MEKLEDILRKPERKVGSGRKASEGIRRFRRLTNTQIQELISIKSLSEIADDYNIHLSAISKYLSKRDIFKKPLKTKEINYDNVPEILFNENSKVFSKNEMDYGRGMSQKQWIETLNL